MVIIQQGWKQKNRRTLSGKKITFKGFASLPDSRQKGGEEGRCEESTFPLSSAHQHLFEAALSTYFCSGVQLHHSPDRPTVQGRCTRNTTHNCSEEAQEEEYQGSHLRTLCPVRTTGFLLSGSSCQCMEIEGRQTLWGWPQEAALTVYAVRVLFHVRRTLLSTDWTEHRDPGAALRYRLTFDPGTSSLLEKSCATCKRRWGQGFTVGGWDSASLRCLDSRVKNRE